MSDITRRSFLKQSGATAAAAGALVATPKVLRGPASKKATADRPARTTTTAATARKANATRTLVVHVPDTSKAKLRLLVGDREVILHDRDLVTRLSRAAH
jgi:anaerobic selenocysteine-containing dehydrogenase